MTDAPRHLPANAATEEILEALDADGGVIIDHAMPDNMVDGILEELNPYIAATTPVNDDFAGHHTTRTRGLVVKSAAVRELVVSPLLLGVAESFLAPYTDKIQLNLTQIIRLLPGETAQELHRDRFIWSKNLPREIEPQLNSIWALSDFTEENGATRLVPGSHRWDWGRTASEDEVVQAAMQRGSVLIYTGSVMHAGGENRSNQDRIALNVTYCNGWLRQEENQYLTCPPDAAQEFSPQLRALLGYTMANYALGYFSPTEFQAGRPDTQPPELMFADGEDLIGQLLPKPETF